MRRMLPTFVSLFLVLSSSAALKVPFHKRAVAGISVSSPFKSSTFSFSQTTDSGDINDVQDTRYVTNITINGVQVPVALDTGSTDLWVIPPGGLGTFNDTGIELDLLYGDGSYGTSGTIGVAPFEFGSYSIAQQAFLNAVQSTIADIQNLGIYGLMGLSFDLAAASPINKKIQSIYGSDATWGRSVLKNIFMQNPTEPNFIAIELSRTGDLEDTSGGSFTIGEYLSQHADVVNQPKLPQYPVGGDRWTVLLEGAYVDGTAIAVVSNITGVPSGQGQALLDTGDPAAIFPVAMYDAIYSGIPGSALYNTPGIRTWIIPCNTTTSLEFVFGGKRFPIHPLDLSTISDPLTINGQQYIACIAAFQGADGWGAGGFDVSLGDSFLRNVYSIFDFGDTLPDGSTSDPYIQLFSTLDPATAISQVATIRGQTMANLPPEMDPATLVGLLLANGTDNNPSSAATLAPTPTDSSGSPNLTPSSVASESDNTGSTKPKAGVDLAVGENQNVTIDGSVVTKYGLIIICLLAANLLIGIVLVVFGILACVRRGSSRKNATRASAPVYVPVKSMEHDEGYSDFPQKPYSQ